jgi:hypothetical protein
MTENKLTDYPGDSFLPEGSRKVVYDQDSQQYIFRCPHCDIVIAVEKSCVACHIFRHGNFITMKDNSGRPICFGDFIPPHAPKTMCDELVTRGLIVGCGKPLQMYKDPETGEYHVRICDYI